MKILGGGLSSLSAFFRGYTRLISYRPVCQARTLITARGVLAKGLDIGPIFMFIDRQILEDEVVCLVATHRIPGQHIDSCPRRSQG